MTILEKPGDLTTSQAQIILHQVNCQGAMNSGVAKAIRDKWPEVYSGYRKFCEDFSFGDDLLGKLCIVGLKKQCVVNLFGQKDYGYDGTRYTSYDAVWSGLSTLRDFCQNHEITSIALPYMMCCGRGGANWNVILAMITSVFESTNIVIEIWRLSE